MASPNDKRLRGGFTLVEMLVTMGIIMTLASILMPALRGVRECARRTHCQNNFKHVGMGFSLVRSCLKSHVLPIMVFDGPPEKRKRMPNPGLVNTANQLYQKFSLEKNPFDEDVSAILWQSPALRMYFALAHLRTMFSLMGVPAVTAPTEAEIFAALLCRDGIASTAVSNDSDALLFGSPHVTKQLHFSKGLINRVTLLDLEEATGLDLEQLKDLAIICGCDFYRKGVNGVGPRKGTLLLEKHRSLEPVLKTLHLDRNEREDMMVARESFDEVNYIPPMTTRYKLNPPIIPSLRKFLEPLYNASSAEKQVDDLVGLWRRFGSRQETLDQWL